MTRQLSHLHISVSWALACWRCCRRPMPARWKCRLRKAGLWEMKMVRTGSPVPDMTMQHCTDETTDKEMSTTFSPMARRLLQERHPEDRDGLCHGFRLHVGGMTEHVAFRDHRRFQFRLYGEVTSQSQGGRPACRATAPRRRSKVARRLQAGPEARRHHDARRHEDEYQGHGEDEGHDPKAEAA